MTALAGCASVGPQGGASTRPATNGAGAEAEATPPKVERMPAIGLVGFDGRPGRVEEAAAGKVVLVSFWATWCDACLAEMDALNRLDDRARAGGGMVLGVAVGEPRAKAAELARQRGLRYAQLVDEEMKLADALGQRRLPATMVLDRTGRVVFVGGALDERALAAFRDALGAAR